MIGDAVTRARLRTHSGRKLWLSMLGCSLFLHASVLTMTTAWSGFPAARRNFAPVYSVDLVSLPAVKAEEDRAQAARGTPGVGLQQAVPLKRFRAGGQSFALKKSKRPVIADRQPEQQEQQEQIEKRSTKPKPEQPGSRAEAAGETGREQRLPKRSSKKVSLVNIGGMEGEDLSQALGLYRAMVYEKVEGNWVPPGGGIAKGTDLEALIVVRARRDGTIVDIRFEKKSGNARFDDSVLKAILKSKPFPPFPEIYSPKEEEIVIRFSPADGRS
ncbi:MAG: energy transducer TonB [Syntrophobacteria bacterium]